MNKKNGISLLYVLIIMSFISVFSTSFLLYVKNKEGINRLEKKSLSNAENKNIRGILLAKEKEFAKEENYFTSTIIGTNYERLIYQNTATSIGGYKIINSTKQLPLVANTKYENVTITYSKKVLQETFYYVETLEIIPNSTGNVDIKVLSKELR